VKGDDMKSLIRNFKHFKHLLIYTGLLMKYLCVETCQYFRILFYQYKDSNSPEVVLANLRVLSHALDKGMCVTDRQPTRGYDNYKTCKQMVIFLENTPLSNDPSLKWARDRIEEYEHLQQNSNYLKGNPVKVPTAEERKDILTFIRTRRSVRNFKPEKINSSVLSELVDLARWAPNSCCRQSVFLYVTEKQEQIDKCMNLTLGATCFSKTVPCFICVCGDMRFYLSSPVDIIDKGLLYIDGALAAGNLLLAAHAYGIEGTILNWCPHMRGDEKKLREVLGIAPYHSIVLNIALGYPDFMPPAPARRELNSVWKLTGVD
jgi:nitroreductase